MSEPFPTLLTTSERVALERIKAGESVTPEAVTKAIKNGWARRRGEGVVLTEEGSKALLDDFAARASSRSARTRRPR